jgi:hypothetical protein
LIISANGYISQLKSYRKPTSSSNEHTLLPVDLEVTVNDEVDVVVVTVATVKVVTDEEMEATRREVPQVTTTQASVVDSVVDLVVVPKLVVLRMTLLVRVVLLTIGESVLPVVTGESVLKILNQVVGKWSFIMGVC